MVKDQTDASENGIYEVAAGAWSRTDDANTWDELVSAFVFVESGTTNADTGWVTQTVAGGTLGTDNIPWTQFSSAGQVTAGAGSYQDWFSDRRCKCRCFSHRGQRRRYRPGYNRNHCRNLSFCDS